MSKVSNLAETDPMEFAKVLSEKLQRVLDEQNQRDMVRSKLSAMSEVGRRIRQRAADDDCTPSCSHP